ncbi:MAG: hypothetical protein RLZ44_711, partial [Pseudomonadota bacterium]
MSPVKQTEPDQISADLRRLLEARHHDPFAVLGRHERGERAEVRVLLPGARDVRLPDQEIALQRRSGTDLFEWQGASDRVPQHYRIAWTDAQGQRQLRHDPYCFGPQIGDLDLHLFGQGRHWHAYQFLGAHLRSVAGVPGVSFAVWAPNAERVSVVGDFNAWDGRVHPMRSRGGSGVWELFIPDIDAGALYKFELRGRGGVVFLKADPYAQRWQHRPETACMVVGEPSHPWGDRDWMAGRETFDWQHRPMSIYELHLGSWARADGDFLGYRELAERLVPYVSELGFTHIELLPVTEHPLDASWGYQTTGYFAPTSRFGSPEDFRWFIDHLHQHGIGVLLDWVPAHFPRDQFALASFDGTPLYEHEDPRRGEHRDWGTLIFNYGRNEVRNFLLASALYWLEEYHIDGLRVDAVASMLYLDYSREPGDWVPNQYGGRENLEAVAFLRELNEVVHQRFPGAIVVAEESTAWPQVSRPTWLGGLGFSMKWNMGWMHDLLAYTSKDPVFRHYHHDLLTFGLLYAFSENFVLPFSHDEVVHGKGSMIGKMPGDDWQQFASLRLLYAMQWTYPGKKLLFMGSEFAQRAEWNHDAELEWDLLQYESHRGVLDLVRDLNRLYRDDPALHHLEFKPEGFEWIDCHDASQSVLSYLRTDGQGHYTAVLLNFTPVPREGYRIGLPCGGWWAEVINTDSASYWGSNLGNG